MLEPQQPFRGPFQGSKDAGFDRPSVIAAIHVQDEFEVGVDNG